MSLQAPSISGLSTAVPTPSSPASTFSAAAAAAAAASATNSSARTLSYVPYFTAAQLETLYAKQRGGKMPESKWISNRNIATGFIQAVASRLGFMPTARDAERRWIMSDSPQRTTATAQTIYQRFHLFYPPTDFVLHEVALASLFLSSKLNDTPKKARDILLASYALRFPELVKGHSDPSASTGTGTSSTPNLAGTKRKAPTSSSTGTADIAGTAALDGIASSILLSAAIGSVSEGDIDASVLETDRKRLMALEKLLLESICFHFQLRAQFTFSLVVKVARRWELPKSFGRTAWRIAADMARTPASLQCPPNVLALASIYAAALIAVPPPTQVGGDEGQGYPNVPDGAKVGAVEEAARRVVLRFSSAGLPAGTDVVGDEKPLEDAFSCCIEDIEEAVHDLLDLYLSQTALIPTSLFAPSTTGGSTSSRSALSTPSPQSPADHLSDLLTASPSSSSPSNLAGQPNRRTKLKQYEFAPPPFGVLDWLNTYRYKTQRPRPTKPAAGPAKPPSHAGPPPAGHVSKPPARPTAPPTPGPTKLTAHLTDIKIFLRQLEYTRQKRDEAVLASRGLAFEVVPLYPSGPSRADPSVADPVAVPAPSVGGGTASGGVPVSCNVVVRRGDGTVYTVDEVRGDGQVWRVWRRKMALVCRSGGGLVPAGMGCEGGGAGTLGNGTGTGGSAHPNAGKGQGSVQHGPTVEGLITNATRYLF